MQVQGHAWINQDGNTGNVYKVAYPQTVEYIKFIATGALNVGDRLILLSMAPEMFQKASLFKSRFVHVNSLTGKKEGDIFVLTLNDGTQLRLTLSQNRGFEAIQNPPPFENTLQEAILKSPEKPVNPQTELKILQRFL
jgi:hypothetical protein